MKHHSARYFIPFVRRIINKRLHAFSIQTFFSVSFVPFNEINLDTGCQLELGLQDLWQYY